MIRPYLAVLKDSFREALASRVLWVLLVCITLALVLLAPLGVHESKSTLLTPESIRNWPSLAAKIQNQAAGEGASPAKQVMGRFSDSLKKRLTEAAEQSAGELSGATIESLAEELNGMIGGPPLYDAAVWEDVKLGKEAREMVDLAAKRTPPETARLNRLLLESAWPAEFVKGDIGTRLSYLWFESNKLPAFHSEVMSFSRAVLGQIISWTVGVAGVFAAILVTSFIIPQMFEAGAIDLLLSKPVGRVLLFLTKFGGGCAFIGVLAAYFITGLWLIAGTRFGIWNHSMFICIPIMLFLFAIFYGVSALAGVIWRNAIISVIITVLFWAFCSSIGYAKFLSEIWRIDPPRLVKVIPAGSDILGINELGGVSEWNSRGVKWQEVFVDHEARANAPAFMMPERFIGPVYDAPRERIVAATSNLVSSGPGGGFNLFAPPPPLVVGNRAGAWSRKKIGTAPLGTLALFTNPAGDILAVTKGAVFRLSTKAAGKDKDAGTQAEFVRRGPDSPLLLDPAATVAMNSESGAITAFSRGMVVFLEPDAEGRYVRKIDKEVVPAKEAKSAVVAFAGQTILIALADGRVLIVNAADLSVKHEYQPAGDDAPRFAAASPDGRWISVVFHNRQLWLYDVREGKPASFSFSGQGDISAVAFDGPNGLLAIDRGQRVTRYHLEPFQVVERAGPELDTWEKVYHFGVVPLYHLLPKPVAMHDIAKYLLKDLNDKPELNQDSRDLSKPQEKVEIARPIWSSLAFLAFTLGLASLYVWRKDF